MEGLDNDYEPIDIDGKLYHAMDGVALTDPDNGEVIPYHICICHAYDESECVCGAWYYPLPKS
jgi:hypothetical protein